MSFDILHISNETILNQIIDLGYKLNLAEWRYSYFEPISEEVEIYIYKKCPAVKVQFDRRRGKLAITLNDDGRYTNIKLRSSPKFIGILKGLIYDYGSYIPVCDEFAERITASFED